MLVGMRIGIPQVSLNECSNSVCPIRSAERRISKALTVAIPARAFFMNRTQKESGMATTIVTEEKIFANWTAMHELFSDPEDALEDSVTCAQCGLDDAYERFGTDYLCEDCLTLIGNVLAKIRYGTDPDENGNVSVLA